MDLEPNETLFRIGEDSESGMFIVVEGSVGVYLQAGRSTSSSRLPHALKNVLSIDAWVTDLTKQLFRHRQPIRQVLLLMHATLTLQRSIPQQTWPASPQMLHCFVTGGRRLGAHQHALPRRERRRPGRP